jgi:YVTN family beta-propeller protein
MVMVVSFLSTLGLVSTSGATGTSQAALSVISTSNLAYNGPGSLSLPLETSGGSVAGLDSYVADSATDHVSVVNTESDSVEVAISVGNDPVALAENGQGTAVDVANEGDGTVSVIDPATNAVTATVSVGGNPDAVVFNQTGSLAFVANASDYVSELTP